MISIDEEERKKRLREAINIMDSINHTTSNPQQDNLFDNNSSDIYRQRMQEAMNIIDSINPPTVTNTIKDENIPTSINQIQAPTLDNTNNNVENRKDANKYGYGNIDLTNRPVVKNDDGSISTLRSISFEEDGKEILIPTVINGKVVSDEEAIDHYHKTGEYLGKFNSVEEANAYAEQLHQQQQELYKLSENINNLSKGSSLFKGSSAFDDGYQFGDITKTWLATTMDTRKNLAAGFATVFENVVDVGANIVASIQDITGNHETAKGTREWAGVNYSEKLGTAVANYQPIGILYNIMNGTADMNLEKNEFEKNSISGDMADKVENLVGYTIGQVVGTKGLGKAGNVGVKIGGKTFNLPTLAIVGGTAEGLQEANAKGDEVNELQRWTKGLTSGIVEGVTEGLFSFMGVGGNEITDQIASKLTKKFSSGAGKVFSKLGIQATGEAVEEFLSYAGTMLADNTIVNMVGKGDFRKDWNWGEVGEQMALAFISTGITGGADMKISTNLAIQSAEQQLGRELTQQEKANVVQNLVDAELEKNENIKFDPKNKGENVGNFYVASYNPDGTFNNMVETKGEIIENSNKKINVTPVIIKDNDTNTYNVIDSATGVLLDTTPYESIEQAKKEFNSKMSNLDEATIKDINNKMSQYNLEIDRKIGEIVTDNITQRNQQNDTIEQNNISSSEITSQENKTTQNGFSEGINNNENQDIENKKSFEDTVDDVMNNYEETNGVESPLQNRDIKTIGKETNVNAYQYDNPEVKPYFQEMAQMIGEDLSYVSSQENRSSVKGGGTKLSTTTKAITTLHDDLGYSYNQIAKGLQDIIEDNGKENNAISKKLELIIDEQLRNGYTNALGKAVASNQEYINTINNSTQPSENYTATNNKGGNENVRAEKIRNNNSQQEISRNQKGKNTRGEKEISRSNGVSQEKLSKSVQQFQREQQKQLGKDTKISLTDQNKLTKTERTIQKEFENITGLNYGIYESNKGTEDAVYVNDDILVKHNSLQSKKKSNFLPFHELGHWFKVNRNAEWTAIHDIIDNTITKNQMEEYKKVLKDESMFDNMSEVEIRDYIIEEIESDYFGNWANDISNWANMIKNKLLSDEYVQLLIDISDENVSTHYNIFGTQEQQEQVYGKINEMMNNFVTENKNTFKNDFESNLKYSNRKADVIFEKDGKFNRVKINEDIFANNTSHKSISRIIHDYLMQHIGEYYYIIESGQKVYLGDDLPNEYTHSVYSQNIKSAQRLAKGRAVSGLKEIIENATNRKFEPNRKEKHKKDAKYGFYRYETTFSFEHNNTEQIYSGIILIRNDEDGKKYLYDILDIKKIGSNLPPVASNSKTSSAIIGGSNSLPTNSIAQKNKTVKSNTTTNNSNMQKSKNNTIKKSERYDTEENGEGGFYSQLEKVLEEKMPNTSNAQQIKGIIENSGVKQDEIKWIGLDDYLKQHSLEKISKQQLQEYIKANQINIETVQKGTNKLDEYTEPIKQDIASKNIDIQYILDKYGFDYERDDLIPYKRNGLRAGTVGDFMAENLEKYLDLNDFDKYEKQEDGSYIRTYRDSDGIQWTTQFTENDFKEDMQKLENLYDQRTEAEMELSSLEDEYRDYADELGVPKYKKYSLDGGTNYQELLYTLPYEQNGNDAKNLQIANVDEYNSPHWQEKNVLAHARTQDFKDTSGNKVLFIDEIQSDLHQEGRSKGYLSKENSKRKTELQNKINELKDNYSIYEQEMHNLKSKAFDNAIKTYSEKQTEAVLKSELLEEKYNIQNNLTEEQQYELLDYVNSIEQYLIMQNRQFMNFRENIDNNEYMQNQVQEAEEKLKLKLPKEIAEKQKDISIYRQHAIESFRINHYDRSEVHYGTLFSNYNTKFLSEEEQNRISEIEKQLDNISSERVNIEMEKNKLLNSNISEEFPFKKNWHEFVLRRMINNAVEQGYDEVAWTSGRQQRERYNLSKAIDYIEYQRLYDHPKDVDNKNVSEVVITAYKDGNNVFDRYIKADELADYIGKDLATRILEAKEGKGTISNLDEEVRENGNSGMYLFYDQEIPAYLNKYLKKWNSKVEEITLQDADGKAESKQMGFKITDEMRNSIKQNGQPLFSNRQLDEEASTYDERSQQRNREFIKELKEQNLMENIRKEDVNIAPGATNAQGADRFIEQEIRKIETSGKWDNSIPTTRLTDIRNTIEEYLGLGIKKGHFRQRAYGIYKQDRDVIRGKELKDIDNILHETGHALDLGNRLKIDKNTLSSELLTAVKKHGGYENETRSVQLDEGFAEVIRTYSIIPEQAKADYPQSVAVLEEIRKADKPFDDFIKKVQQQTYNYIHQNPQNRVHSNISIGETNRTPLTKAWLEQEVMRNVYDKDYAVKKVVNEFTKISGKTVNQTKASNNAYYLTRLASGIHDKVTSMLSDGYINEKGDKLMPGLNKVGEILGDNPQRYNDLRDYLVARRDTDYKAKTLKTGIRDMDTKYVLEKFANDSQIKEASQVIYDTLDGVMTYAVENGLISQDEVKKLKESNAFYVPMQRVIEGKGNQVGRRGAVTDIIKARTGSELDIKDVLENIVANSSNIIQQVENNNILKALYNQGEEAGLTGSIYDVIDTPMMKVGTANLSMWENELKKQGVNTNDLDLEKTVDLFAPNNKVDTKNLITSFINNDGKRVYLQFNDEILFNSLMNMDKKFMSQILKINSKLNMPLRYGATMANIGFAIPNMISDTAQASIFSNAGFIPVVDNALGVLDILTATNKHVRNFVKNYSPQYEKRIENMYNLYKQTGATNSTRMSQFRDSTQNNMKEIYGTKNSKVLGIQEKYKPLKRLLDIMTYIPEISEQSTRFRVFEKNYNMYKSKGTSEMDSRILAALESRDATQDFGRTGNLTREINQLIPFSAARVGSAYTFAEKVKANPKQTMMRIAILSAIAMAIKAAGYDDKEIEELNQRKKDDNFVMKVGDNIVTIKKPQGLLRSIVNLTEYIQDLATDHIEDGKEGERLGEWINNAIMDNMPADSVSSLVPNMVAPLIENAVNKDFYYNTDIVKSYDLDLPDSEQYYDYNSQLAIMLGKVFNYSPAKIDNLISGYFAGLGTQITGTMDYISGKLGLTTQKPEMGAESDAVGKRFIVNVNSNSASVDEIYNRKTELTKKKNGGTITEEEDEELTNITNAATNMSKVNKQIREIKADLTLSGEEKAEQIKELQQQRTDIARQALGKDLIHEENTSNIETTSFYPTNSSLSLNKMTLELTSDMKKEYANLASEFYKRYERQGLYSEEKLKEIKSKAKDYAKKTLMQKYKSQLVKNK